MAKDERKRALTGIELIDKLGQLTAKILNLPVTVSRLGHGDYNVTGIFISGNKVRITTEIAPIPTSEVKNEATDTAKKAI